MKKLINHIVLLSLVLLCFMACETDAIDTYSGKDNIYFTYAESGDDFIVGGRERRDSIGYSFAFDEPEVQQMLVKIPFAVQGNVSTEERVVKLVVDEASTVIEGTHFEIPSQVILGAGKAVDSLPITFFRVPEMKTENLSLVLRLESNENFTTDFKSRVINSDTLSLVKLKITINDILKMPLGWYDYYQGDFTAKKFFLMSELLDFDPIDFNDPRIVNLGVQQYYATFMQRYLNEQEAVGNTIYEDDGSKMVMGPGVQ